MSDFRELSRSVKGLTVLVTGAASGMGRATALVFAAEGANVAVTDLNAEATQAVASEIAAKGGTAKAWALDVADRDAITTVVGDIAAHFGGLDIVINNAGLSLRAAIDADGYDESWTKALAVMPVRIGPGQMQFTVMPSRPSSTASERVRPTTPALAAE